MKIRLSAVLAIMSSFLFSLVFSGSSDGAEMDMHPNKRNRRMDRVGPDTTIGQLLSHPAFSGFGQHLLTREEDVARPDVPLRNICSLLPYHSDVDTGTVVDALNHMIDDATAGKTLFYSFYNEGERRRVRAKEATGLFFFRGTRGAPFAVICPGGGFSYVGSFHEGFPYAMELSKRGYNAFVLRYRVGGAALATEDLAAALSFIFANARALEVDTKGYSLWGSSAGARMAAYVGSRGAASFGGNILPKPAAVIMAYTGHSEAGPDDPPTFPVVGDRDGIAPASVMENRIGKLRAAGVDADIAVYRNIGHGFGLGVGTGAEGWIDKAVAFWQSKISHR